MNTQITEDYVSFETAKLLKEKGFNANITTYRDDFIQHGNIVISLQECLSKDKIKNPTLQMAMKWLREVHNLYIGIVLHQDVKDEISPIENYYHFNTSRLNRFANEGGDCKIYYSYEAACEAAIKYCLTNLI